MAKITCVAPPAPPKVYTLTLSQEELNMLQAALNFVNFGEEDWAAQILYDTLLDGGGKSGAWIKNDAFQGAVTLRRKAV